MTRREKIEAMLADDPGDTFLRYSLAMELDKEGNHDASLATFAELARRYPPYVPAFFMAGQQLVRLGRTRRSEHDPPRRHRRRRMPSGRCTRRGRDERIPGVARISADMMSSFVADRGGKLFALLFARIKFPQFDILVPHLVAVVLQADVAFARKILNRFLEFVRRAVEPLAGFGPFIAIDRHSLFRRSP